MNYQGIYCRYIKRVLDIICAMLAMLVFCWLYAVIAVLVRIKLGSPIIFSQERPGMIDPKTGKEKIFKLYKFRSMTNERNEKGELLPDPERLTRFGRILRATSLDELPEAWNILKGDMSVIGPRPLLVRYLDHYNEFEKRRHRVRPGLSGLAQVRGRNQASWEERFVSDVEYTEKASFLLDVKIILQTVAKVVRHEGVEYQEDCELIDHYFDRHNKSPYVTK